MSLLHGNLNTVCSLRMNFCFQVFTWSILLMQLGQNVFFPEMSLCLKFSVTVTKVADLMKSSPLTMSALCDYLHGTRCYFKLFCLFNNVFSFSSVLGCQHCVSRYLDFLYPAIYLNVGYSRHSINMFKYIDILITADRYCNRTGCIYLLDVTGTFC